MKGKLGPLANDIAAQVLRGRDIGVGQTDWDALRDFCDQMTFGDASCSQLDRLTDMVERRVKKAPEGKRCRWFAMCTNVAHRERHHPLLGPVPICKRCDDKLGALAC